MTQGRGDGESWVTAFMLSYSLDAYDWQYVEDHYGNQRVRIATHALGVNYVVSQKCVNFALT